MLECPVCQVLLDSAETVALHFAQEHDYEPASTGPARSASAFATPSSPARSAFADSSSPLSPARSTSASASPSSSARSASAATSQTSPAWQQLAINTSRAKSFTYRRAPDSHPRLESIHDLLNYGLAATTVPPMPLEKLRSLARRKPSSLELQFELVDHRKGFNEELWNHDRSDRERTGLALELVVHALGELNLPETHSQLLLMVKRSPWFSHLAVFLQGIRSIDDVNAGHLRCAIALMSVMLLKMPSCLGEVHPLLLEVDHIINRKECGQQLRGQLQDKLQELQVYYTTLEESRMTSDPQRGADEAEDFLLPPEKFLDISILPNLGDIHRQEKPFLRVNKLRGRYQDLSHYLDVQFRLIRQDLVAPLSEGIQEYRRQLAGNAPRDTSSNVRFYKHVHLLGPVCSRQCISYRVRFDVTPFKRLHWKASKRFLHGSLVCLSCDGFTTILFGTVANSNAKHLKKGMLDISFEDRETLNKFDHTVEFVMVESPAFYESYRHVLQSMKVILQDGLAMKKYILECSRTVDPPSYLTASSTYDMSCLLAHHDQPADRADQILPAVCVLDPSTWPSADLLGFNESQHAALLAGLSQEFALIQGPPGTGKTYVGIKIVQVLLANKSLWSATPGGEKRPILVVCYTNHALDQFLEGIQDMVQGDILRIGGQSRSSKLDSCKLVNVRNRLMKQNKISSTFRHQVGALFGQMNDMDCYIETCTAVVERLRTHLVSMEMLEVVAVKRHFDQLCQHQTRQEALMEWLGSGSAHPVHDAGKGASSHPLEDEEGDDDDDEDSEEESANVESQAKFLNQLRKGETSKKEEDRMKKIRKMALQNAGKILDSVSVGKGKQDGWSIPRPEQRRRMQNLRRNLQHSTAAMTTEQAEAVDNIWQVCMEDRWRLYHYWVKIFIQALKKTCVKLADNYQACTERLHEIHRQQDLEVMRHADIVGMTTSGASRYHAVLQQLTPPILIIEEAAEVLEAHVIASFNTNLKHLVLIGDHQQLRPNPTVYDLAKMYHLDLSLFERMVNNNIHVVTLTTQHRMRPEICQLVRPIYPVLLNHVSVLNYEHVRGVKHDVFFINHTVPETHNEELYSKANDHEAQFTAALCRYLLQQGYDPSRITVLTPYNGQLICLSRYMRSKVFKGVRVSIVDSYQGEENDIILLSLVRSNPERKIGFLNTENRICVALSRAKIGLYIIGDFDLLSQNSLWKNAVVTLGPQCRSALPLYCQNHPEKPGITVACEEDFQACPDGGCRDDCHYTMDCGHQCILKCHPYDPDHQEVMCQKPCLRMCQNYHGCSLKCHEDCKPCKKPVEKVLHRCESSPQHKDVVECHQEPDQPCMFPCRQTLPCGHACAALCSEPHTPVCLESVKKRLPCGHVTQLPCHQQVREISCEADCSAQLACGHECQGSCAGCLQGRLHRSCMEPCERRLLCGHRCQAMCHQVCPPCDRKCRASCSHKNCRHYCGEDCLRVLCPEPCAWHCEHLECKKAACGDVCDRPRCNQACPLPLECGHPCQGMCGEACPPICLVCQPDICQAGTRYIYIKECGHIVTVNRLDEHIEGLSQAPHLQLPECPKCHVPIYSCSRYNSITKILDCTIGKAKSQVRTSNLALQSNAKMNSYVQIQNIENPNMAWKELLLNIQQGVSLTTKQYADLETLRLCITVIGQLRQRLQRMEGNSYHGNISHQIEEVQWWLLRQLGRFSCWHGYQLELEMKRLVLLIQFAELGSRFSDNDFIRPFLNLLLPGTALSQQTLKKIQVARLRLRNLIDWAEDILAITEEERTKVAEVMTLVQDHWRRCPNGHVTYRNFSAVINNNPECSECVRQDLDSCVQMASALQI